jgi:hypothetical protein
MSGPLTPAGEAAVADLAQRYRVSDGAVRALLDAVVRGGGAMAQFSHPELGGSGQWMRGGMTMVGDMFNSGLQTTVSGICSELSSLMVSGEVLVTPAARSSAGAFGSVGSDWWPSDLGRPSSSGGQNDAAYAYFPGPRRLAIRRGSQITLYDTGEHAISGVQQQQGGRGSLEFSSQFGTFTVDSLAVVGGDGGGPDPRRPESPPPAAVPTHGAPHSGGQSQSQRSFTHPAPPAPVAPTPGPPPPVAAVPAPPAAPPPAPAPAAPPPTAPSAPAPSGVATSAAEIGAAIETLGGLRDKGFHTEEEFAAKKAEILARL